MTAPPSSEMSRDTAAVVRALPEPPDYFVERLRALQAQLREAILVGRIPQAGTDHVAGAESDVVRVGAAGTTYTGDTIYRIDERGEAALLSFCEAWARQLARPFVLIAEGLPGNGRQVFPASAAETEATFECIVDPIDGTRGLMYGKRSAWALAAIAPGAAALGRPPTMADIAVAVQTELPTERARLADCAWAVRGQGTYGVTLDLVTGRETLRRLVPSQADTLAHGFATVSKFFPGSKELAVWVEERLFAEVVGEPGSGAPLIFDDEYISSGGQLYELMAGHDRFVADLRPALMDAAALRRGETVTKHPLCARPYDLCTALIAEEAGVIVTDTWGGPLNAPLDTDADVSWIGYANQKLRAGMEPVLQRLLRELGLERP